MFNVMVLDGTCWKRIKSYVSKDEAICRMKREERANRTKAFAVWQNGNQIAYTSPIWN